MALAAASAIGSRLMPFALKGARALFQHIKEHHQAKLAALGKAVPHQLNFHNAIDIMQHPDKAKGVVEKLMQSGVGSVLTKSGLMSKYLLMRQMTPKLLDELATALKTIKASGEEDTK